MNQNATNNIVDTAYHHYEKTIIPHGIVHPNNSHLKWYDIACKNKPIHASIRNLAQQFLNAKAASTGVPYKNELGFTLLHSCGENSYFLMLCTWRNSNELWKTVYHFDTKKAEGFAILPQEEEHKATFCVWELAVITHETSCWTKYLLSGRKQKHQKIYLLSLPPTI